LTDSQLLARALSGDREALERLCRDTWPRLYSFVYWQVQSRDEAEDIVQETYCRLLAAAPRLEPRNGEVAGLLRTIAANLARDGWRRQAVRGPLLPLDAAMETPALDEAQRSAERLAVHTALAELPEDQRRVIELRLLEGYSVRETAAMVVKSEVAVRSLQYRGLQRMAELLADSGDRGRRRP